MLGIDIGSTAVRVARAQRTAQGVQIAAVAVREIPSGTDLEKLDAPHLAAILEDAATELKTRDRRCVCAIGEPDALLRPASFPAMRFYERERAAKFEAAKYTLHAPAGSIVRIHPAAGNGWVLGIARTEAVTRRSRLLRSAGLRPVAIDHESCALLRAFPSYDAILDVGERRTCLHVRSNSAPRTHVVRAGGADVTSAIQHDIGLDGHAAEKRKRILGTAGAGEAARAQLVTSIVQLLARVPSAHERTVAITGNGARLCGLAEEIANASGFAVELAVPPAIREPFYPLDVASAAAPDWALAAGLALWLEAA